MRLLKHDDLDYLTKLNSDPDARKFFPHFIHDREQTKTQLSQLISYFTENNLPSFLIFSVDTKNAWQNSCPPNKQMYHPLKITCLGNISLSMVVQVSNV